MYSNKHFKCIKRDHFVGYGSENKSRTVYIILNVYGFIFRKHLHAIEIDLKKSRLKSIFKIATNE